MPSLTLRLLGPPEVERDGVAIEVDTRKAIALLAYLALHPRVHRRDALATMFWPQGNQTRARTALRRTLSALNKALGKSWSSADRETVGVSPEADVWLDVAVFHELLAACETHDHEADDICPRCLEPLTEAVALVRDEFMAGFGLRDSPEFDEWQFFQAETIRRELSAALNKLARCHAERQEFETAIEYARRWLSLDPLHEPAHRCLMQLYFWSGQRGAALRQYHECVRVLEEDLGAFPLEETIRLYDSIRERRSYPPPERVDPHWVGLRAVPVLAGGEQRETAGPVTARVYNLPHQSTPFIGRETELREIAELMHRPSCHLLTLIGPGGIGKTRLALQVATNLSGAFPQGVYFIPLASVSSPDFLVPAIAEALQFTFYGREGLQIQLINYLREKQMLLVLDNFEQLLTQAELLTTILENARQVKLLVTSQERLNLQEEWLYEVQGLTFPQNGHREHAENYSAVQLFLQRATRVQPDFTLSEADRLAVAQICQLVDGMPLGLELAAAWVRLLSPQDIAHEIENNLDFLATSLRDVPDRHRSLRAVFEHSWRLLTPRERALFRELSVFRGGFRRDAAEKVTGAALPILLSLANKSFLRRSSSGRGDLRYTVPEILGLYAEESGDETAITASSAEGAAREAVRRRHAAYYADYLKAREVELRSGNQKKALDEISEEIENIRAAWQWAVLHGDADVLERSLDGLYRFYATRSWLEEGEAAFAEAVACLLTELPSVTAADEGEENATGHQAHLVGRLMARQGRFCVRLSRNEQALELFQRSLGILHAAGDRAEVAAVLSNLGIVQEAMGNYDRAQSYQEESLALSRAAGDELGTANALARLGNVALARGEYDRARQYYEEGRLLYQSANFLRGIALCLNNLGGVADRLGQYEESKRLYEESLIIKREIGDRRGIAFSLNNMGFIATLQGAYLEAKRNLQESYTLFKEVGDRRGIGYALNNLGNVARGLGEYAEARQRCREALAIFTEIGDHVGIAFSHNDLGTSYRLQGDHQPARSHYAACLRTALEVRAVPVVLDGLAGMAMTLVEVGEWERALQVLGQLLHHEATSQEAEKQARSLLSQLEARHSAEQIAAGLQQGESRPLSELVAELLGLE